jgi:gliding motility-associated-like protein
MKPAFIVLLLACVASFSFGQSISNDSLVVFLPFNGSANDQSGNNYHGVINGATLTTGPGNQPASAYYFNGTNNSIIIPNISRLDRPLTEFTILIRLQPENIAVDPTVQAPYWTSYSFLTWHRNRTDSLQAFFRAKMRTCWQPPANNTPADKNFLSYIMDWCNISGTASGYTIDSSLANNQWHTVAYVYKAGTVNIYHNCQRVNHWTIYPNISEICGTEPVQISLGNIPQAAMQYGYRYFKGKIDELRVYTRALSENEVKLFADSLCKEPRPPFQPVITIKADDCYPNQFVMQDKSDTAGLGFMRRVWKLNNVDSTEADSFAYSFTRPGTYSVKLTIYAANGVYTKDTIVVVNSIGPRKFLRLNTVQETVCAGQQLQPQLSGGTSYQWQPCTYLSNCTEANPLISPAHDMTYTVAAIDAFGCNDTTRLKVAVIQDTVAVYFPSAFTPNNDGKNDQFGVASSQQLSDFSLQVFNRWGQLVFRTTNSLQKWNGMLKGQPAPTGVYVWTANYKSGKGCSRRESKGTVLLLR